MEQIVQYNFALKVCVEYMPDVIQTKNIDEVLLDCCTKFLLQILLGESLIYWDKLFEMYSGWKNEF